ncbi:MAG: hypothetical protein IJ379_11920 [Lachnospiraceae bacterium]|nr:hypothetical protein [Lachnospiraceae bacterium]
MYDVIGGDGNSPTYEVEELKEWIKLDRVVATNLWLDTEGKFRQRSYDVDRVKNVFEMNFSKCSNLFGAMLSEAKKNADMWRKIEENSKDGFDIEDGKCVEASTRMEGDIYKYFCGLKFKNKQWIWACLLVEWKNGKPEVSKDSIEEMAMLMFQAFYKPQKEVAIEGLMRRRGLPLKCELMKCHQKESGDVYGYDIKVYLDGEEYVLEKLHASELVALLENDRIIFSEHVFVRGKLQKRDANKSYQRIKYVLNEFRDSCENVTDYLDMTTNEYYREPRTYYDEIHNEATELKDAKQVPFDRYVYLSKLRPKIDGKKLLLCFNDVSIGTLQIEALSIIGRYLVKIDIGGENCVYIRLDEKWDSFERKHYLSSEDMEALLGVLDYEVMRWVENIGENE